MKKMKIMAIIMVLAATAMVALTACGSDADKIAGTWKSTRYGSSTFYSDGRLVTDGIDQGTWKVENNKLIITDIHGNDREYDYKLEGDTFSYGVNSFTK